jgi:hypothetical protein
MGTTSEGTAWNRGLNPLITERERERERKHNMEII